MLRARFIATVSLESSTMIGGKAFDGFRIPEVADMGDVAEPDLRRVSFLAFSCSATSSSSSTNKGELVAFACSKFSASGKRENQASPV